MPHRARCLAVFPLLVVPMVARAADDSPRFQHDVRPLLSEYCYRCHGPDAEAREGDLRLDTREGLFGEASSGRVLVPGEPAASELIRRITSDDPDLRMPPAEAKKPLSAEQIATLKRWVAAGAEWEGHWAFTPPKRPTPPSSRFDDSAGNAIDNFVLARLERERLQPSEPASRETLIRSVSLDLTGIPPTPAEVDAFLADDSPDAYERLVDRLLASPQYGERMAVQWLDAARYADTSGYQNDGPRDMWRWRDWVIDAYNANQPFDEFSIEQLAGDLLPDATLEQRIATGFNRNHRGNSEGGIVPEEFAVEYVVDRVDTTATVWLGLTAGCARCHDHKYDPLTQREYYQLFDYFNDVPENGRAIKEGNSPPYVVAPTPEQARRWQELRQRYDAQSSAWSKASTDFGQNPFVAQWDDVYGGDRHIDWTVTDGLVARFPLDRTLENVLNEPQPTFGRRTDGSRNDRQTAKRTAASVVGGPAFAAAGEDGGISFAGDGFLDAGDLGRFHYRDPFTVSAWVRPAKRASGGIVTRMSDDSYHDGWALHLESGRVQVNLVKRWLDDSIRIDAGPLRSGVWQHVCFTYDGSRRADGIRVYVDGKRRSHEVLHDFLNQDIVNDEPLRVGSTGTEQRIEADIREARVYDRVLTRQEVRIVATPEPLNVIAKIPRDERTGGQWAKAFAAKIRTWTPVRTRDTYFAMDDAKRELADFERSLPKVMVMHQAEKPRPAFVLKRGEYDKPGEPVEPGVPAVLDDVTGFDGGKDRLGLAEWLFDPWHPLTARVAVNREWQRFFGRGIVETTEDFGTQGSPPSHPELLDWLATEFVRSDWDVKRLHRLIVTSATYRQASAVSPELAERDPGNRLLARGPRFRLSAEVVRDQALAAAGLLAERVGGPSVKPYQPDGLWSEIASTKTYERSTGPDLYRRSLYSYKKRTVANPTMSVFDATTRESCLVRRSRTNTPLQALALQNDVTYVEAARVLAERSLQREFETEEARLVWLFRRALVRRPTDRELAILSKALARHGKHFAEHPDAARELLLIGESRPPGSLAPTALAAHTAVASLILNLDETVARR